MRSRILDPNGCPTVDSAQQFVHQSSATEHACMCVCVEEKGQVSDAEAEWE